MVEALEEGCSEEPVLTAALVEATTLGSSGGLLKADSYVAADKVPAFWKHCCGYAAAAGGLNGAPAQITEHTLREIYLKPWRRARTRFEGWNVRFIGSSLKSGWLSAQAIRTNKKGRPCERPPYRAARLSETRSRVKKK